MAPRDVREAIEKLSGTLVQQPEKARVKNAPATAVLEHGLRCRVTGPGNEAIETDMPAGLGGEATAPNPGWYLRAALASCNATVIAMRAARLGIGLTHLEVRVESESDTRGMLGLGDSVPAGLQRLLVHVRIGAPRASADQLRHLVHEAISRSPVGCADLASAATAVEIVRSG